MRPLVLWVVTIVVLSGNLRNLRLVRAQGHQPSAAAGASVPTAVPAFICRQPRVWRKSWAAFDFRWIWSKKKSGYRGFPSAVRHLVVELLVTMTHADRCRLDIAVCAVG